MSKTGTEIIEDFSNFVNNFNCNNQELITAFRRQHRTLQQAMMKSMLLIIEDVASDDYQYDGRNVSSHQTAKRMIEGYRQELLKEFGKQSETGQPTESDKQFVASDVCLPSNLPCI